MTHFFQAIRLSMKYKWSIVGSVISSMLIAVLFCVSISTLFPIIKIVLEKQTAAIWIDKEITTAKSKIAELDDEQIGLKKQLATTADKTAKNKIEEQITINNHRLKAEKTAAERYEYLQPIANRFAPTDPFMTLVAAMVFLLVTALVKLSLIHI